MTQATEKKFVKIDSFLKHLPTCERKVTRDSERALPVTPETSARNQFTLIDCCFLAAIMAKLQQDPFAISEMIRNNGDGTYIVRLPGNPEVRVSAPTCEEIADYLNSGRDSLLLALIKKGYRQLLEEKTFHLMDVPVNAKDIASLLSMSVTSVTGHHAVLENLIRGDLDATRNKLEAAMNEKRIVAAGIRPALYYIEPDRRPNGLPMGHSFTVLAFDKESDTVTLLNPWGRDETCDQDGRPRDGVADGIFQMKTYEFFANFSYIAYEA